MKSNFSVTVMPPAKRSFLDILALAETDEDEDAMILAMEKASLLIQSDAANIGEPVYDLKQMKMRVCRILVPPLYVEYGVHFTKPIAFIRRVVLLRKPS